MIKYKYRSRYMLESLNKKSLRKAKYKVKLHLLYSTYNITLTTNYNKITTAFRWQYRWFLISNYFHFNNLNPTLHFYAGTDRLLDCRQDSCVIIFCYPGQVAQLVGALSQHRKAVGWVPSQGTYLGCRLDPWLGHIQEATDPPDRCCSLPSSFSKINKRIIG